MRRKHWIRKRRKKAATEENIRNQHKNAAHIYVDGVLLRRNDKIDISQIREIKVTGTLYFEVMEFTRQFTWTTSDPVIDLIDLSEGYMPDNMRDDKEHEHVWHPHDYAFARKVILPANCTDVWTSNACGRHQHTEELVAMPDHPYLKSVDGVLYSKDGSRLLAYPFARKDKSYTLQPDTRTIASGAFMKTQHIEEIIFNDGLQEIEDNAISYMPSLKRIHFGPTLRRIDCWAIFACDGLEEANLPATLQEYIYEAIVCNNLRSINVKDGGDTFCSDGGLLYNKKENAFVRCPRNYQGQTVQIKEGTRKILSEAFNHCANLRHLHLPKSLETIEPDTFNGSENIESITIEDGNECFCIDNGILYSADKTQLIFCPPMLDITELAVPDTVVKIEEEALAYNQNIIKLTIPDSVKEVGHCFLHKTNVREMWLPAKPPIVTESINAFFKNDQYIGHPRREQKMSQYTNMHIPKGSLPLYEADGSIWHYLSGGYIETAEEKEIQ